MKRLFRKGELVRNSDGRIMEVLSCIGEKLVEVWWFDIRSREVYRNVIPAHQLSKVQ